MKTRFDYILFAVICVACLTFSGCLQYRSYEEGSTKYKSLSLGVNNTVAPFSLEAGRRDSESYRKLESKGLTNDSTALVESAVGAAVRAATGK